MYWNGWNEINSMRVKCAAQAPPPPSCTCTDFPSGGTGSDQQRCIHGNTLNDGYTYQWNDPDTPSTYCGDCGPCCRRKVPFLSAASGNVELLRSAIATPFYLFAEKRLRMMGADKVAMQATTATAGSLQAKFSMDTAARVAESADTILSQRNSVLAEQHYNDDSKTFMQTLQPAVSCAIARLHQMFNFYTTVVTNKMQQNALELEK